MQDLCQLGVFLRLFLQTTIDDPPPFLALVGDQFYDGSTCPADQLRPLLGLAERQPHLVSPCRKHKRCKDMEANAMLVSLADIPRVSSALAVHHVHASPEGHAV